MDQTIARIQAEQKGEFKEYVKPYTSGGSQQFATSVQESSISPWTNPGAVLGGLLGFGSSVLSSVWAHQARQANILPMAAVHLGRTFPNFKALCTMSSEEIDAERKQLLQIRLNLPDLYLAFKSVLDERLADIAAYQPIVSTSTARVYDLQNAISSTPVRNDSEDYVVPSVTNDEIFTAVHNIKAAASVAPDGSDEQKFLSRLLSSLSFSRV